LCSASHRRPPEESRIEFDMLISTLRFPLLTMHGVMC